VHGQTKNVTVALLLAKRIGRIKALLAPPPRPRAPEPGGAQRPRPGHAPQAGGDNSFHVVVFFRSGARRMPWRLRRLPTVWSLVV
jgi:hypothetical protein